MCDGKYLHYVAFQDSLLPRHPNAKWIQINIALRKGDKLDL